MRELVEFLRTVDPFSQLPEDDLAAVAERAELVELEAGAALFNHGDVGDRAYVILEGSLEVSAPGLLEPLILNVLGPGDLVGETSLLRGATRNATVTARSDSRLAAIDPEDLKAAIGKGAGSLLRTLLDRWEQTRNQVVRGERLAQLGTLASGVAHELNNPAAAVSRSSDVLGEEIRRIGTTVKRLVGLYIGPDVARSLERLEAPDVARPTISDPLARSSAERAVSDLLEEQGVGDAWALASALLEAGLGPEEVGMLADAVGPERFIPLVELIASVSSARRLAAEIGWASSHMSRVAQDLSSYSRLGEAPVQEVDVAEGIERTLTLLEHRLREIQVERQFDPNLPLIAASGSELNQVWTNLVANAADAAGPEGRIIIRCLSHEDEVVVEVEDDGPGIAPEDLPRIFDAFFTTKPPGSGTGLGLAISQRIIADHHGAIEVDSEPGRTVFRVRLPIERPTP